MMELRVCSTFQVCDPATGAVVGSYRVVRRWMAGARSQGPRRRRLLVVTVDGRTYRAILKGSNPAVIAKPAGWLFLKRYGGGAKGKTREGRPAPR